MFNITLNIQKSHNKIFKKWMFGNSVSDDDLLHKSVEHFKMNRSTEVKKYKVWSVLWHVLSLLRYSNIFYRFGAKHEKKNFFIRMDNVFLIFPYYDVLLSYAC